MTNIKNIWAVGRNYAEHAKELSNEVPTSPLVFLKSGSTIQTGNSIKLPNWESDVQHEIELCIQLDSGLNPFRYGVALDLTDRKAQTELKKQGLPWTLAKSFIGSCPLGPFKDFKSLNELKNLEILLTIDGAVRQKSNTSKQIFDLKHLIDYIKSRFPVEPNDLILTGTPEGVSSLKSGQEIFCKIGELEHTWKVL